MEWFLEAIIKFKKTLILDRVSLLEFLLESSEELEADLVLSLSDIKS